MRRPLPVTPDKKADWHASPFRMFSASGVEVNPATACGDFTNKRAVDCRWIATGQVIADTFCSPTDRPVAEEPVSTEAGCVYSWQVSDFLDPGPSCTANEIQTRSVTCMRTNDGLAVADAKCTGVKPASSQSVADYSACTYHWDAGAFVDPGPSCTLAETQQRTVTCKRDLDGATSADNMCDPATKPATSQQVQDFSACTYAWESGAWVDPGPACTAAKAETRSVTCHRQLDDAQVADSFCSASAKPAASQTVADYAACSYSATNWSGYTYSSTCSATATKTRTAQCLRSDGTIVAGTECTTRGISLTDSSTEANYTTCTASWATDAFVDPGASCTANEVQTRNVWCKRDLDGTVLADSACNAATRPAATQSVVDYSGCSYSAVNWTAWSWNSTCSATATRTQTAQCKRSDGTIVADTNCTSRSISLSNSVTEPNYSTCTNSWATAAWVDPGASCTPTETLTRSVWCKRDLDGATQPDASCSAGSKPASTMTQADYSGCSYAWQSGAWIDPGASCTSNETQTRSVTCLRSDGTTVADTSCNAATKPATSQTVADYSACSYAWQTGAWSNPGPQCTATETQTRSVTCMRSDGTAVADASCTGAKPAASQIVADYSACSYVWVTGAWADPGPQCTASETQTRSVICQRSDGTTVADTSCTGTKPAASQSVADYSACSYAWVSGAWNDPGASCTSSETQTRSVVCRRSDGSTVADASCTGAKPTTTQTVADYSGCSYAWVTGAWVDPGPQCTSTETQTRSVVCQRSDGTTVADGSCTGTKPAASQTVADYSACSYSAANGTGAWNSTCSASATYTTTYQCKRSDGTIVADTNCTSRGISLSSSSTGANYSSCTYSWATGGWVDPGASCTANETLTRSVWCKRDLDGATVADTSCSAGTKPATTMTQADYSGCTYSGSATPTSGCSAGYQPVSYSCKRSDGTIVAPSYCGYGASTGSQACTSYAWQTGGWGSWSTCSGGTQSQTRAVWCQAQTGSSVSAVGDEFCGSAGSKPGTVQSQSCANCPNPNAVLGGNSGWYYCTGNVRLISNQEQADLTAARGNLTTFFGAHRDISCIGYALYQPTGGTESDTAYGYTFVSDGVMVQVPAQYQTWQTYNLNFQPYPQQLWGGSPQYIQYWTGGQCVK